MDTLLIVLRDQKKFTEDHQKIGKKESRRHDKALKAYPNSYNGKSLSPTKVVSPAKGKSKK